MKGWSVKSPWKILHVEETKTKKTEVKETTVTTKLKWPKTVKKIGRENSCLSLNYVSFVSFKVNYFICKQLKEVTERLHPLVKLARAGQISEEVMIALNIIIHHHVFKFILLLPSFKLFLFWARNTILQSYALLMTLIFASKTSNCSVPWLVGREDNRAARATHV